MSGQEVKVAGYQRPVNLIEIAQRGKAPAASPKTGETSFKDMFSKELADTRDIEFSKHAHKRMHSRGLELSPEKLNSLANAVDRAETKGSKDTLVLSDDAAYVVSVANRTVVTVFDRDHLSDGVVTAIDPAVII